VLRGQPGLQERVDRPTPLLAPGPQSAQPPGTGSAANLELGCLGLVDLANERGGVDNITVVIARVQDVGVLRRVHGRAYGGEAVSFMLLSDSLEDLFRLLGDATGFQIVSDPTVKLSLLSIAEHSGPLTKGRPGYPDPTTPWILALHISKRPAMQVLDLILAANDLVATRLEISGAKPSPPVLTIGRRADIKGEPVDLSRLTLPPAGQP